MPHRMRPLMSKHASDGDGPSNEDKELRARLDKLSGALAEQRLDASERQKQETATVAGGETGRAMSLGFRVLSEFVAGVVVGFLIGWQLDVWLSTSPLFLIVFLALGTAAGFWNVYRIAAQPTTTGRKNKS
jgi:ATP synthase protein I